MITRKLANARTYTEEELDDARLRGYEAGALDAAQDMFDRGMAEGLDEGYRAGYLQAKEEYDC